MTGKREGKLVENGKRVAQFLMVKTRACEVRRLCLWNRDVVSELGCSARGVARGRRFGDIFSTPSRVSSATDVRGEGDEFPVNRMGED